jgi:hypothetical protein
MTGQLKGRRADRATGLKSRSLAREKIEIQQLPNRANRERKVGDGAIDRERLVTECPRAAVVKKQVFAQESGRLVERRAGHVLFLR